MNIKAIGPEHASSSIRWPHPLEAFDPEGKLKIEWVQNNITRVQGGTASQVLGTKVLEYLKISVGEWPDEKKEWAERMALSLFQKDGDVSRFTFRDFYDVENLQFSEEHRLEIRRKIFDGILVNPGVGHGHLRRVSRVFDDHCDQDSRILQKSFINFWDHGALGVTENFFNWFFLGYRYQSLEKKHEFCHAYTSHIKVEKMIDTKDITTLGPYSDRKWHTIGFLGLPRNAPYEAPVDSSEKLKRSSAAYRAFITKSLTAKVPEAKYRALQEFRYPPLYAFDRDGYLLRDFCIPTLERLRAACANDLEFWAEFEDTIQSTWCHVKEGQTLPLVMQVIRSWAEFVAGQIPDAEVKVRETQSERPHWDHIYDKESPWFYCTQLDEILSLMKDDPEDQLFGNQERPNLRKTRWLKKVEEVDLQKAPFRAWKTGEDLSLPLKGCLPMLRRCVLEQLQLADDWRWLVGGEGPTRHNGPPKDDWETKLYNASCILERLKQDDAKLQAMFDQQKEEPNLKRKRQEGEWLGAWARRGLAESGSSAQ